MCGDIQISGYGCIDVGRRGQRASHQYIEVAFEARSRSLHFGRDDREVEANLLIQNQSLR